MKLSILTPTYNRAKMLPDLYQSLKDNLKYEVDFEWLIMDDGSTDNTKEVVDGFIKENIMQIKYFYQENQGKMAAINKLAEEATGDFMMDCDSDDCFAKNAFGTIKENIDKLVLDQELYALIFLKCDVSGEISGEKFKEDNYKTTMFDLYFKDDVKGEKILLFNSRIRKQFKHQIEKGEKFITEARMYHEMDKHYKVLGINKPLVIGAYLADGYTKNIKKVFLENPRGYMKYFEEILGFNTENILPEKRLYIIKHYILFSYLTKSKNILKPVKNGLDKFLIALLYIPGVIKTKFSFIPKRKKLLFSSWTLEVGGIETALVNLVNEMSKKYDVTLVLEHKRGPFLNKVNKNIKIIEYTPSENRNIFIRKMVNFLKRIKFTLKHKNKYDFSVSFATYSRPGSFTVRTASKNNLLWIHSNYMIIYKNNIPEIKQFFESVQYDKFKNIVCISEDAKKAFLKVFPNLKNVQVINNIVDYKTILEKAEEKIDLEKADVTTFLSVCRHEERAKKLTRLIEAGKLLKDEGYKFRILFVGEGEDTQLYKELVEKYDLGKEIIFCGMQANPYPYFKISDCVILTSEYEGYPVIFTEAKLLEKPIITTNVSDSEIDIKNKYGIVVEKNVESIKNAMELFIKEGYNIKEKFKPEQFNKNIVEKLEKLL